MCEILQHPAAFVCARVRVRATIESDCFEHSLLVDEHCERGIVPYDAPVIDESLFNDLCRNPRGPHHAERGATFTGQVLTRRDWGAEVLALQIDEVRK